MHMHISTSQSWASCLAQLFWLCKSLLGERKIWKCKLCVVIWHHCVYTRVVPQAGGVCVQDLTPTLCPHTCNLKSQSHDRTLQHRQLQTQNVYLLHLKSLLRTFSFVILPLTSRLKVKIPPWTHLFLLPMGFQKHVPLLSKNLEWKYFSLLGYWAEFYFWLFPRG